MITPRQRLIAHIIFWPVLGFWTYELVHPNPVPPEIKDLFLWDWLKLVVAKALHVSGYAFLTYVLGYLVPRVRTQQLFYMSLMMFHGLMTEIIQTIVPHRTGRPYDVLIDWLGIMIGLWIGRRQWAPIVYRQRH